MKGNMIFYSCKYHIKYIMMTDNDITISVIVPVYNVEKYLHRCVNSILNQSYSNIEIILINDGSKDSCPMICDQYAKDYNNIHVIHKTNGGLSSARNCGIEVAQGDFITFIDSDDWIDPNTYTYCINKVRLFNADAIEFNYISVNDSGKVVPYLREKIKVYYGKDILQYYMESSTKNGSYSVWRMLVKKNILKNLRFREGRINEDIDFKYKVLSRCNSCVVTNQKFYYYFQSSNSLSTGKLLKKDFDLFVAADELCNLARDETYGSIKKLAFVKKARTPFSLLCKISYFGISNEFINKKNVIKILMSKHRKYFKYLILSPMPKNRKILSLLYFVNFTITDTCIKFAKKCIEGSKQ